MRKIVRNSLFVFLVSSLLIHISVWVGLSLKRSSNLFTKKDKIEIVILDQSLPQKKMRIVEQNEKPLNDETPEDAELLSAHNQRVVKETRATETGEFRNSSGRGANATPAQEVAKKTTTHKKMAPGTLPTLSDLRPKFDPNFSREINEAKGADGLASQTNDYLKDKDPSLQTLLSTREFVYYTYYQRIRTQIRQFWEPSIRGKVKKIFAQGRSIASEKDHITRVVIILDKNGSLMRVQIVGESGLKDLDDAAVEAFRMAEPFPNPPKGIVEKDGTIKINWDFILEANNYNPEQTQRYARNAW
jgi:TonB family protein